MKLTTVEGIDLETCPECGTIHIYGAKCASCALCKSYLKIANVCQTLLDEIEVMKIMSSCTPHTGVLQ